MVLATRTSAPNTSLAVIRPKPRPDSPTASEISVIMLKSELPHEASNPVSKKTARVHHSIRRGRGGVATRHTRPEGRPHSAHRRADEHDRGGSFGTGRKRGVRTGIAAVGLGSRIERSSRYSLGCRRY